MRRRKMSIVKRNEDYNQVCVWRGTIVGADQIEAFEKFFMDELDVRVQYLEEIKTKPDLDQDGQPVPETGDRNDVFFAVHDEDVGKFAVPRLAYGVSWIEDVLSNVNYESPLYPDYVFEYKTWDADSHLGD